MSETATPQNDQPQQSYVTREEFRDLFARVEVHEIRIGTQEDTTAHLSDRITRLVRGGDPAGDAGPL